jgi:hypothetical protein
MPYFFTVTGGIGEPQPPATFWQPFRLQPRKLLAQQFIPPKTAKHQSVAPSAVLKSTLIPRTSISVQGDVQSRVCAQIPETAQPRRALLVADSKPGLRGKGIANSPNVNVDVPRLDRYSSGILLTSRRNEAVRVGTGRAWCLRAAKQLLPVQVVKFCRKRREPLQLLVKQTREAFVAIAAKYLK